MSENVYELFPIILHQRLSYKRYSVNHNLRDFSTALVYAIEILPNDDYLWELLNENISALLTDCEIFFEMYVIKAIDTLSELSNYACIYVYKNEEIYTHICKLIEHIKASFPN